MQLLHVLLLCSIACLAQGLRYWQPYQDPRDFSMLRRYMPRRYDKVCTVPVDIVFIMDRSRSIYPLNFDKEKEFVQGVVKMFDSKTSRFGVLTFAEGTDVAIKFGSHGNNQQALLGDIGRISQEPERGGSTETWAALQLLRTQYKSFHNVRPGALPIAILITDGASQLKEKTRDEAAQVHALGIEVFAVGIKESGFDEDELRAIASEPDSRHLFMLDNWEAAIHRLKEIGSVVCPPENIDNCKHNRPMDLVFSLSNHATLTQTAYAFDLVEHVIGKVTLGSGHVQVGLGPRDCPASWQSIALNAYDTSEGYSQALMQREGTFTSGLELQFGFLANVAFTKSNGAQSSRDTSRVAVVVVDSTDGVRSVGTAVSSLRRDKVRLVVLAVNGVRKSDVSSITSSNYIIEVNSYAELSSVHKDLLDILCDAQKNPK